MAQISSNKNKICIVGGLGHVGLPLAISLAKAGMTVTVYDIDAKKSESVKQGKMPFLEEGAEDALKQTLGKSLFLSNDKKVISENYFVIVVIGTPVDEHLNPQFTVFKKFFGEILDHLHDDQHVVLRSTIFPGTTEKVKALLAEKGKKTSVSFCPERIAQGHAMRELHTLPQIVASFDEKALTEVTELFSKLTEEIIPLSPYEAELGKLFINVWRYIQFAISNQFYQIATQQGLDWYRIYGALTQNYPRAQGFPTAGFAAGPCLFKDTMQLAAFSNNHFFLGHAAMLINEGLPAHLIQLAKRQVELSDCTAGILGLAFKGESDDPRDSLSYKLRKLLWLEARRVLTTDPFVPDPSAVPLETVVEQSDVLFVATPHKAYRDLVIPSRTVVIDCWNHIRRPSLSQES